MTAIERLAEQHGKLADLQNHMPEPKPTMTDRILKLVEKREFEVDEITYLMRQPGRCI